MSAPSTSSDKVCFTLESTLPNSVTITLAGACLSFLTAFGATLLAAALIFFGLRQHQSERRFCVVVSVTLASIVSGVLYFDKYWSLTHKAEPSPTNGDVFELVSTTTDASAHHLVFISPGLCETLQFLQEFSICSIVVWLSTECLHLIRVTSSRPIAYPHHNRYSFGVYLVPGLMYPLTFTCLWLIFKLLHREYSMGCFERNDYDLTTSIPNCFVTMMTCFFAVCLVIVFMMPSNLRRGPTKFAPCLISWLACQPLQALTLLQTLNYLSKKYDIYYGEAHDFVYQILHMSYGLWIVALYSLLVVFERGGQTRRMFNLIV